LVDHAGAGDVPEPGRGEVERRLPVGERAHDARAMPDLAQDALDRIVRADSSVSASLRKYTWIFPGVCKHSMRISTNASRKAVLMMAAFARRRRRISQTMELMSCTYICSMIPRGLISCSKASRTASNSSADSVISNGDFGRSANSFLGRI
jgi:hypothetical protein